MYILVPLKTFWSANEKFGMLEISADDDVERPDRDDRAFPKTAAKSRCMVDQKDSSGTSI